MTLTASHDVVSTRTPDTANEALHRGILPRTPGGSQHVFGAPVLHPLLTCHTIDTVPIAPQLPRGFVPRDSFGHVRRCPLRSGVRRHAAMHDAAPFMGQDEQHKKHSVRDRRAHEAAEFSHNPWRAPGRSGLPHRPDQLPALLDGDRPAWLCPPAPPGPVVTEPWALPGDHRTWLDEGQGILPT